MKKTIKIMAAVALLCVVSAVSFEFGKRVASTKNNDSETIIGELKQYSAYQDSIIEEISTHCWEDHDCDCSWYDGDYPERCDYMHNKYNY